MGRSMDLPDDAPPGPDAGARSGGAVRGRDGCRVPLPWERRRAAVRVRRRGGAWLPQPAAWRELTVAAQAADPASMLALYRRAIALRRELARTGGGLRWNAALDGVLDFTRPDSGLRCVTNVSGAPCPVTGEVLLASTPLRHGRLEHDAAAWLVA